MSCSSLPSLVRGSAGSADLSLNMTIVVDAELPSVFLPPLKQLRTCSDQELANAITRLRDIYLPEVRGSSRRHSRLSRDVNFHIHYLDVIRADTFERSFAIQWLTRFVSIFSEVGNNSQLHDAANASFNVLEEAASLLAICAGAAASGSLTRTFTFPLSNSTLNQSNPNFAAIFSAHNSRRDMTLMQEEDTDRVKVILRDAPLESADVTSVGAQTWGGSCILAEMIAETPQSFGVFLSVRSEQRSSYHLATPFRALELGAGTGLASLVLGKVMTQLRSKYSQVNRPTLSASSPSRDVIVATDFHPTVLANLRENVSVNFPSQDIDSLQGNSTTFSQSLSAPHVIVLPLDWSTVHNDAEYHAHHILAAYDDSQLPIVPLLSSHNVSPLDTPFDLIIGADIIYEGLHARWVRSCVERFLRKPAGVIMPSDCLEERSDLALQSRSISTEQRFTTGLFHLLVPLRRTHRAESRSVEEVFPQILDVLSSRRQALDTSIRSTLEDAHSKSQRGRVPDPAEPAGSHADDPAVLKLAIINQDDILCDAYSDQEDAEEVVYRYYRIGWV